MIKCDEGSFYLIPCNAIDGSVGESSQRVSGTSDVNGDVTIATQQH
jgi:hypothetical protein